MIRIEKILCRHRRITGKIRPAKRVRARKLPDYIKLVKRSDRLIRERPDFEGFKKIEVKTNHRMYFAMLNDLEKNIKRDHYTDGKEHLVLIATNGNVMGF